MSWKCYHQCLADVVPARPRSKVTTTFPAVFMIAESSSFSPAANIISFWTNWGGPDWTSTVVSSELSKDDPSVSLSSSDSLSEVSPSWQAKRTIGLIQLCIPYVMWSNNGKGAFTSASVGRIPFSCRLTWGARRVSLLHSLSIKRDPKRMPTSGAKRRTMFPGSTKLNLWTHAYHRLDLCWVSPTKQKILNCDFFFLKWEIVAYLWSSHTW